MSATQPTNATPASSTQLIPLEFNLYEYYFNLLLHPSRHDTPILKLNENYLASLSPQTIFQIESPTLHATSLHLSDLESFLPDAEISLLPTNHIQIDLGDHLKNVCLKKALQNANIPPNPNSSIPTITPFQYLQNLRSLFTLFQALHPQPNIQQARTLAKATQLTCASIAYYQLLTNTSEPQAVQILYFKTLIQDLQPSLETPPPPSAPSAPSLPTQTQQPQQPQQPESAALTPEPESSFYQATPPQNTLPSFFKNHWHWILNALILLCTLFLISKYPHLTSFPR